MDSLPLRNILQVDDQKIMKNLFEDIRNYYSTKTILKTIYCNNYHHLIHDLELFFNNFKLFLHVGIVMNI